MLELEPEIAREFHRYTADYREPTDFNSPCLSVHDVMNAHFQIANHFYLEGSGIGGIGPKDMNMLESTVCRQVAGYSGKLKWTQPFDVAATLYYGIIKNHCFHDANKRTAFLSMLYQLYQSNFCPKVPEKEIEDFTVDVAEGRLSKYSRYRDLVKSGSKDPEVSFISFWFKQRCRRVDKQKYTITYRELQRILGRYDFHLENPDGNYIDVVRYTTERTFFGLGKPRTISQRIIKIGFPRWTAQVFDETVKQVRYACQLSHKDGVDSGAFFHGLDPIQSLITTYNAPLMRLADR